MLSKGAPAFLFEFARFASPLLADTARRIAGQLERDAAVFACLAEMLRLLMVGRVAGVRYI